MRDDAPLVLIIDDDDDSRYVYARLLVHRGYAVAQAETAEVGLPLVRSLEPSLVIMDYLLPGMSGWEATRLLKADGHTARVPVLNITAYSYPGIRDDARAAGCDDFIEKPCDPYDVIQAVSRLIGPASDRPLTPRRSIPAVPATPGDAAVA